jgi:hypothetical protein
MSSDQVDIDVTRQPAVGFQLREKDVEAKIHAFDPAALTSFRASLSA